MKKYYVISGVYLRVISFCLLLFVVFAATACTTSSFLGFGDPLTTSSYVDSATADSAARISETEEEILRLAGELDEMKSDIDAVSNIKADLDEMPREMLRQLVLALQSYLELLENER